MRRLVHLTVLLAFELLIIGAIALPGDLRRHVPIFLALFGVATAAFLGAVWRARQQRAGLRTIIFWAILLRVPMFAAPPSLSDDVWRYVHDGRAQNAGVNPFRYAPADPATIPYRGPDHDRINHPELPTIYPPLAQLAFRAGALDARSLLVWRLILLAAEVAIILFGAALVRRRDGNIANLAIYAWHPLAIFESIGSAHLDAIGIALMVAALAAYTTGSQLRAGVAAAASVATKIIAAPLLVLMTRNWKLPAAAAFTLLVLYTPFLDSGVNPLGSLRAFAERWESNGSIYTLIAPLIGPHSYRLVAVTGLMGVIGILRWKRVEIATAALIYFFALLLLAPVVHPWYLLWILAMIPLRRGPPDALGIAALAWTLTVVLAYVAHRQLQLTGVWTIPVSILMLEYGVVLLAYVAWKMLADRRGEVLDDVLETEYEEDRREEVF